jgi:hypothetical protein
MINFPSSPVEGQKFTQGLIVYTFTSGAWQAAPLGTALPFNYVVNGSAQMSQQLGRSPQSLTSYIADQWVMSFSVPGTSTASETNGYPYYLRAWCGTATPTLGTTDLVYLMQLIEGNRVAAFQWGTASAKPAVLRFKARLTVGPVPHIFGVAVRPPNASHSFVRNFSITTVGVFQEFTMAVPGPTVGTWPVDATLGNTLAFTPTTGTAYITPTQNAWVVGNFLATTGINNFSAVAGRGLDIADVGLYLDPLNTGRAPPFEAVSELQAHMDSLRYWRKIHGVRGISNSTYNDRSSDQNIVSMRAGPAFAVVGSPTTWDAAVQPVITSIAAAYPNIHCVEFTPNNASAMGAAGRSAIMPIHITDSYDLSNYLTASARM